MKIYECEICGSYHPWEWVGDCRDDANRIADPDEYARDRGIEPAQLEGLSMEERLAADLGIPVEEYRDREAKTDRARARNADHIDGYDRDDLGESPDY